MASRAARGSRRPRGPKHAFRQQLQRALAELGTEPLRDVSVHEARKQIKKARATLRLLRDAIGEAAYRHANRRLRDSARPLSRVRDAKAQLDAIETLCGKAKDAPRRAALAALEPALRRERERARSDLERPAALPKVRRAVAAMLSGSRSWPAGTDASMRCAVERIYRKGRKTFARAEEDRRETTLHESRKRTKDLEKALEVLAATRGRHIAKPIDRAASIADALGDDHDLVLLHKRVAARRRSAPSRQALLEQIARRRRKLQRRAAKVGRRLYRRKPKAFVGALDLRAPAR